MATWLSARQPAAPSPPDSRPQTPPPSTTSSPMNYSSSNKENEAPNPEYWTKINPTWKPIIQTSYSTCPDFEVISKYPVLFSNTTFPSYEVTYDKLEQDHTITIFKIHQQQLQRTQFLDDFEFFARSSRVRLSAWEVTGQIFSLILAIWFSWALLGYPLRYIRVLVFPSSFSFPLRLGDFLLLDCWYGAQPR